MGSRNSDGNSERTHKMHASLKKNETKRGRGCRLVKWRGEMVPRGPG